MFLLERRRYHPARGGKPARDSRELVYGITSLAKTEAGPEKVLRLQRDHWTIVNQVPWVLNTLFGEDRRRLRDSQVLRAMATLTRRAHDLLHLFRKGPRKAACDYVTADPTLMLPVIGVPQER